MIISLICPRHGYQSGDHCLKCEQESDREVFYTPKDKLFEFTDINVTGKPVEIRSKGQWKAHLKRNHCHDDINQSRLRPEDITGKQFDKTNFKSEMLPIVKEAFREKHRWMPKEKFYRER